MDIEILKDLMDKKRFSQRKLAKEIGMSHPGFNKAISTGEFKVSTLEKIANVLEVDISTFFSQNAINSESSVTKKLKDTVYITLLDNLDATEDEKSWVSKIKIAKEFENKNIIPKSLQLCEQSTLERILSLPKFDYKKMKNLGELQFKIHSWLYDNSYQTSENKYESLEVAVLSNDEMEYSNFLQFVLEHKYSTIPNKMQSEFSEKMTQFRKYLQSFIANLVLESEVFQQLAIMGIISELTTNPKVIEYYMMDIKFCRWVLMKDFKNTMKQ